ncbi:DUF2971 domain-containing protein [Pseudidiomarina aquimaris]|uniref:DUF2971 domain-containing protein n=1 Tax=Pseudidiomarina aquimaris TaxID=641841 RepID=UPI003A971376
MDITSIGSQVAHYTTFEVAENIIKSKQIWLSGIDRVNDPREYSDWNLVARLDQGGIYDHEVGEPIREELNKLKKFCKISCFSEDSDSEFDKSPPQRYVHLGCIGRCYANPVLWHHYADKHKGVCLVFDKQLLIDNLSNSAGTLPWRADSVEYARGKFARDLFSTEFNYDFHQANDESYPERFINERSKDLFFRKHLPWQAENEFRLFLYSRCEGPFRLTFGSALKKIVVSDLGKDDIAPLLALARNSGIRFDKILFRNDSIQFAYDDEFYY